ncbi:MAG: hypothetical protein ABL967_06565 [Bryobacteraceae bacterium]
MKTQVDPAFIESDHATGKHLVKCGKVGRPPINLGLDVSECLFHLRSTLDYIAHRLGDVHSTPIPRTDIKELRKPEFPIFGDRAPHTGEWEKKIGRAHPDAINIIKSVQPYLSGDFAVHPLWVLHELNNIDKHRMITPCVMSRVVKDIRVVKGRFKRASIPYRGAVVDGAIICTVETEIEADFKPEIEVELSIDVGFDDTPVVPYESIRGWLEFILKFIKRNIIGPLQPFL